MNRIERYAFGLISAALATGAIAWIAFQLQQDGFAPAVLFPLLVGAALGAALAAIGRYAGWPGRRAAVAGAVCWGLLAVAAQDYIGHRHRLRQASEQLQREHPLAMAVAERGEMLPTFFDHVTETFRARPVWWALDFVLTAGAAAVVTAIGIRRPAPS